MDYSLSEALKRLNGISSTLVIYDIMCQYGKHLTQRLRDGPYLDIPEGLKVKKGIGLFHIMGHQRTCHARYSPQFIKGAGQIDGEILETLWAPLDHITRSTRGMSTASRREMIDGHMNDSNFKKVIGIGAYLPPDICRAMPIMTFSINFDKKIQKGRNRVREKQNGSGRTEFNYG
jgi:hypothetical protein